MAEEDRTCELFVGNLVKEGLEGGHSEDNLRAFFDQFGVVTEVDIKRDNHGIGKGFAFVRFMDMEAIDAVIKNYEHNLVAGVWLDCKRSVDRSQRDAPKGARGSKGSMGGRGSGMGGKGGSSLAGRHSYPPHQQQQQMMQRPVRSMAPQSNVMTAGMMQQQPQGGGMLAAALLHPSVCPPGMVPGWVAIGDPNAMTFEELGIVQGGGGGAPQGGRGSMQMHRPRPY